MDNIASVAKTFFGGIWKMFLQTDFPGTDVSLASILIAIAIASFSIRLFGYLSGFGLSSGDYGRASTLAEKYKADRDKYMRGEKSKFNW